MALATYGDLKTALADWLIRGDIDQRAPDIINLALATCNKVIRSTRMVANADIVVAAGARKGVCPADMLEPIYVQIKTDEDYPLQHVDVLRLTELRRSMLRNQAPPRFYSIIGQAIEVAATPIISTTLDMAYYQEIPAFGADGSTNWLLTHEPDVMLYASLLHAAPFLKDDAKTAVFENMLTKQLVAAISQNSKVTLDPGGNASMAALSGAGQ